MDAESTLHVIIRQNKPIPQHANDWYGKVVTLTVITEMKLMIYDLMVTAGMTKAQLAKALGWKTRAIHELFDLEISTKMERLEEALAYFKVRAKIEMKPIRRQEFTEELNHD